MKDEFTPAEAFPPHEHLQEELKARGWSVEDFATMARIEPGRAREIVRGNVAWNWSVCYAVARATSTSYATWRDLNKVYRRWLAAQKEKE